MVGSNYSDEEKPCQVCGSLQDSGYTVKHNGQIYIVCGNHAGRKFPKGAKLTVLDPQLTNPSASSLEKAVRDIKKKGRMRFSGKELSLCYPFHPSAVYPLVSPLNAFLGIHEARCKKAAHKKGVQVYASLSIMASGIGVANSGKNRQLIVRAKRLLKHLGLCFFKKVFRVGEKLADLFFLTSPFNFRKSRVVKERLYQERRGKQEQLPPPSYDFDFDSCVVLSKSGYPKSWDEIGLPA